MSSVVKNTKVRERSMNMHEKGHKVKFGGICIGGKKFRVGM